MKIPVVLPTVRVAIDEHGGLAVDLDGRPHAADRTLTRDDLAPLLADLTAVLGSPVRVNMREADGTTYADIAIPTEHNADTCDVEPKPAPPMPGITGHGFEPGEDVAIAYVIAHQSAGADGSAVLRLPPALLAGRRGRLMLVGLTSRNVASVEEPA